MTLTTFAACGGALTSAVSATATPEACIGDVDWRFKVVRSEGVQATDALWGGAWSIRRMDPSVRNGHFVGVERI